MNGIKSIRRISLVICMFFVIILGTQLLLQIPAVSYIFSPQILKSTTGIFLWILMWILIFLESGIIPGPYIPFLIFGCGIGMATDPLFFTLFCSSAVACGRILAYFAGDKIMGRAIKWAAMDIYTYKYWCDKFNSKWGKLIYAITVISPGFPDFVLALIAGSVKINFIFYMLINIICKSIENFILIYLSIYIAGFTGFVYIYLVIIAICLISIIVTSIILRRKNGKIICKKS